MKKEFKFKFGAGIPEDDTWFVTSISVDSFAHNMWLVLEKGVRVEQIHVTVEHAEQIGLLNLSALSKIFNPNSSINKTTTT